MMVSARASDIAVADASHPANSQLKVRGDCGGVD
jgi:hypothetical protein